MRFTPEVGRAERFGFRTSARLLSSAANNWAYVVTVTSRYAPRTISRLRVVTWAERCWLCPTISKQRASADLLVLEALSKPVVLGHQVRAIAQHLGHWLVFKPMLVRNSHDDSARTRGVLVHQRKTMDLATKAGR